MLDKNLEKDPEQLIKAAQSILERMQHEKISLQQAMGIEDALLDEIYSLAYGFYNQGKYKESLSLFQFITSIAPNNYKYLLGFAASFHQLKDYENAAAGFYLALEQQPTNPIPAYYIGDCMLHQNLIEEAIEMYEMAIEIAGNRKEFAPLVERGKLLNKNLKK